MLLRQQDGDVIAIGQSSHSWLSGQLARAWGNRRFQRPEPNAEVCLAAEQHDIGMSEWDLRPARNPATGLPQAFTEMKLETHLELWSAAPRRLLAQSRYAALLVSMHGCRLYEMRDLEKLSAAEAGAIRAYFDEQRGFQRELLDSLRQDRGMSWSAAPAVVDRNSRLISTWDFLSLAICLDWAPCSAPAAPSGGDRIDISLCPRPGTRRLTLDPWPFAVGNLTVRCEGRRLTARYSSDEAMQAALATVPWETLEFELSTGEA